MTLTLSSSNFFVRSVLGFGLALGITAISDAWADNEFVYDSGNGVVFQVTADGLSRVSLDGREIAGGGLTFHDASYRFNAGPGIGSLGNSTGKLLTVLSETVARVRHEYEKAAVVYTYEFNGEDVSISARVENNHLSEQIRVAGFRGPTFRFGAPPRGHVPNSHASFNRHEGLRTMHPGHFQRLGVSYGYSDAFGVAVYPCNREVRRTATYFDYNWQPNMREKDPNRTILHFVEGPVPPQGALTFHFGIRVSPTTDWKHLITPYRDYLHTQLGGMQYNQKSYRPMLACYPDNAARRSEANPYGFQHTRELHTAQGVKEFCDYMLRGAPPLEAQGMIIWTPYGASERGAMYRTDFDVWPPEVLENWPYVRKRFEDAGVRLGFASRPAEITVRKNWQTDATMWRSPDNSSQVGRLIARFNNMRERGLDMAYMDVFGNRFEDLLLAQKCRAALGPDWHGYSEYTTDVFLPYFGVYVEMHDFDPEKKTASTAWTSFWMWEVFLWLYPDAAIAIRPHDKLHDQLSGDDFLALADFVYSNRMMLLLPAYWMSNSPDTAARIKEVVDKYLDENGQWKK